MSDRPTELKKTISVTQGVALAVSMVIGSGILGLPGIALASAGVDAAAVGWLVVVLATVPLIAIFAKLGLRYTSAAGLSRYAEVATGPWAAYGVSIVMAGSFVIGIPALGIIGGAYAQRLLGTPDWSVAWFAIAILGLMTIANVLGVQVAGLVNTASLVVLIGVVGTIVVLKLAFLGQGVSVLSDDVQGRVSLGYFAVWQVCALLFWAFIGWENLSFGLEEFRDPERSIPWVYWLSFVLVVVLYLALGFTAIGAQASGLEITGPSGLATLLANTPLGDVLVVVMVLVILANANAWVFGASRLIYAAGRRGILPGYLGRLNRRSVPGWSLVTLFACYTATILATQYGQLSLERLILIVSQNLLVLYAFSIFAYWRTERGWHRWTIAGLALVSWGFLLSGFSFWIAYPVALLLIGYVRFRQHEGGPRRVQALAEPSAADAKDS